MVKNKVYFVDKKLESVFNELLNGGSEKRTLHSYIDRAIDDLCDKPFDYIKIRKFKWPRDYIQKYEITNLWKYDLPNGWRLIYTIKNNEIGIISIILEWFSHKEYKKRFNY